MRRPARWCGRLRLTNGALYSYAWWWCHDHQLTLADLRELARTW